MSSQNTVSRTRLLHWKTIATRCNAIIAAFESYSRDLPKNRELAFHVTIRISNPNSVNREIIQQVGNLMTDEGKDYDKVWDDCIKFLGGLHVIQLVKIGENFNPAINTFVNKSLFMSEEEKNNPGVAMDRIVSEFCAKFLRSCLRLIEGKPAFAYSFPLGLEHVLRCMFKFYYDRTTALINRVRESRIKNWVSAFDIVRARYERWAEEFKLTEFEQIAGSGDFFEIFGERNVFPTFIDMEPFGLISFDREPDEMKADELMSVPADELIVTPEINPQTFEDMVETSHVSMDSAESQFDPFTAETGSFLTEEQITGEKIFFTGR
jgi:hypothetical protein